MEVKADKELQLKQDPQTVWKTMTDPEKMVVSVPGAELTEKMDDLVVIFYDMIKPSIFDI